MKIIAILGDSHTWGEGVGANYYLQPPTQCSDLRMTPFEFPNYVNLIRDAYNLMTGSYAKEYYAESLTSLCENKDGQFGIINNIPLQITENFAFCRVFIAAKSVPAKVSFSIDGKLIKSAEISCSDDCMNKCIKLFNLSVQDGEHTLTIRSCDKSNIYIHRIEFYSGEYAVINCGVGSCTVSRYIDEYFKNYVEELDPYGIIFEGCTINDWISEKSLETYADDLQRMIDLIKLQTAKIIMHTPFPIQGSLLRGNSNIPYDKYIDTMRNSAQNNNIPLVDTYSIINNKLRDIPTEMHSAFIYHDKWHPNGTGHYMYAKALLPEMLKVME